MGKYYPTEGRARSLIHSHEEVSATPNPNAKQSRQTPEATEGGTFKKAFQNEGCGQVPLVKQILDSSSVILHVTSFHICLPGPF